MSGKSSIIAAKDIAIIEETEEKNIETKNKIASPIIVAIINNNRRKYTFIANSLSNTSFTLKYIKSKVKSIILTIISAIISSIIALTKNQIYIFLLIN